MANNRHRPPRLAEWLLARVTDRTIRNAALGDFEERFCFLARASVLKAKTWYWWQVLNSTPSFLADSVYWSITMLKNYLVAALRNLLKRKVHSFINIFGLSLGLALTILIFLFVRNELSYDHFHEDAASIFRIYRQAITKQGEIIRSTAMAPPLAPALREAYPEIRNSVRFGSSTVTVKRDEEAFNEVVAFTDEDFFEVFSFPILHGSRAKALSSRGAIVLSEEMAKKYFGQSDPLGENLTVQLGDSNHVFVVTAVAKAQKGNSSLVFDFLTRIEGFKALHPPDWFTSYNYGFIETYVRLAKGSTAAGLERKLPSFVDSVFLEGDQNTTDLKILLQPLTDVRLNTEILTTIAKVSNPIYSYILTGLGFLVLLIACVNFVTLSVAKSVSRSKEVGVRKVMGAFQSQIRKQHLGEALLTTFLALLLGLALANLMLPTFNTLSDKQLSFSLDLPSSLFLVALLIVISVAAGSYPAVVLARFQPIRVLRKSVPVREGPMSKGLVILQFTLSIILILGTLLMKNQVDFLRAKNLGYDRQRVVEISLNNPANQAAALKTLERFKNEVMKDQRVLAVSAAMNEFGTPWTKLGFEQADGSSKSVFFNLVDYDFLQTLGIEIIQGRDFSIQFATDLTQGVIVNETLVRSFGWENALTQQIPGSKFTGSHNIIGVVKDFHYSSLHNAIEPLVLTLAFEAIGSGVTGLSTWNWPPVLYRMLVRVSGGKTAAIVDLFKSTWHKIAPHTPFELKFLDETIQAQYAQEQRWSTIINYSSIFAIAIACLGLFGLTMVAVEKRVKEIGIRKVLGASVSGIVTIISKELLVLVALANLFAWPVAYLAAQQWLQSFAYRVDLSPTLFALASALTLLIAVLTIGSRAINAALSNPIQTLRNE